MVSRVHRVFVYGTLKENFANFSVNTGQRMPGTFRTLSTYPLFIVGRFKLAWLVNQAGTGLHVLGQVFDVTDQGLRDMDVLEQVEDVGWYSRAAIKVEKIGGETEVPVQAFVYFGAQERLRQEDVHEGPIAEFTLAHDLSYRNAT